MKTRHRIHDIALSLFATQGYEATSLVQISDAVGIQKSSLYNHIQSKAALFIEILEHVEERFFEVMDGSLENTKAQDVRTRLSSLVTAWTEFIYTKDQGTFYKRFLLFPPDELTEPVRRINAENEKRLDVVLEELFEQGRHEEAWSTSESRLFLDAFYCLMDGLFTERFVYEQSEHNRRLASSWTVFWQGMTR